jgi:hypothetical protein
MNALTNSHKYFQDKIVGTDDFDSLDQGPFMTGIRHQFVLSQISRDDIVMDYGCGTGLILERLSPGLEPRGWHGLDFMPQRDAAFLNRLKARGMNGTFTLVPQDPPYGPTITHAMNDVSPSCVVLCGVLGYQGFTDIQTVLSYFQPGPHCRLVATVPVKSSTYVETVIHRFDLEDLAGARKVVALHDGLVGAVW